MDNTWVVRSAYAEAMQVKQSQDEYCAKATAGLWGELEGVFPEDKGESSDDMVFGDDTNFDDY